MRVQKVKVMTLQYLRLRISQPCEIDGWLKLTKIEETIRRESNGYVTDDDVTCPKTGKSLRLDVLLGANEA